jgi:hypothetical protein
MSETLFRGDTAFLLTPEILKDDPFSIRGHHLWEYSWLVRGRPDPVSGTVAMTPAELVQEQTSWYVAGRDAAVDISPFKASYYDDVIGKSEAQLRLFQEQKRTEFERFTRLSDEYPVEIVAGRKDTLCNTCIFGDHCTRIEGYGTRARSRLDRDKIGVDLFKTEALSLGFVPGVDFTSVIRMTDFVDVPREPVTCLQTSMRVVSSLLEKSATLAHVIQVKE